MSPTRRWVRRVARVVFDGLGLREPKLHLLFGAMLLGVVGLCFLLSYDPDPFFVYSRTVDELLADPARHLEREVRVEGVLVPGTLCRSPVSDSFEMVLEHGGETLPVVYDSSVIPDYLDARFEPPEVIVEGRLRGDGWFAAHELIVRCPSKYELRDPDPRQLPPVPILVCD